MQRIGRRGAGVAHFIVAGRAEAVHGHQAGQGEQAEDGRGAPQAGKGFRPGGEGHGEADADDEQVAERNEFVAGHGG